jgi:hypothetical protein
MTGLVETLHQPFGESRSIGWLSELLTEAGQKAGQVLKQIDFSAVGPVLVLRDETFFQDRPVLFMVDPLSSTILSAFVAPDRQADRWGLLLLMAQDQGVKIAGLVEDMARMYPKSLREAGLDDLEESVQKDLWHVERDGGQLGRDLERSAFQATRRVLTLEARLSKAWSDALFFNEYIPAVAAEDKRYAQHDEFVACLSHLCDGLEIVDLPRDAIRDCQTNAWLLEEALRTMSNINDAHAQQWVKTLRRHQVQLLTWMKWLTSALAGFQKQSAQVLEHPLAQTQFIQLVAKQWRLRQALVNGQRHWQPIADHTAAMLQCVTAGSPTLAALAQRLTDILDAACRTSSMLSASMVCSSSSCTIVARLPALMPCRLTSTSSCFGTTCVSTREVSGRVKAHTSGPAFRCIPMTGLDCQDSQPPGFCQPDRVDSTSHDM